MSAPQRVGHAAKTIRARWEQGVEESPQVDAARALEDAGQLLDPEVAVELAALRAELGQALEDLTGANLARWEEEQENTRLFLAWGSARMRSRRKNEALKKLRSRVSELEHTVQQMCDALNGYDCPPPDETPVETATRAAIALMEAERQVSELEAERHSTNEALSDAAERMRADRDRIAELEKRPSQAEVAAWLTKKAREYPTSRERQESVPDFLARLASKVTRGAIRPAELESIVEPELCADCGHVEAAHSKDGETDCNASSARVVACTCAYFIPGGGADPSPEESAAKLRAVLAPSEEPPCEGPPRHEYRVCRDLPETDPSRCLEAHAFSPRDGWRMICGSCDHGKDAECHRAEAGGGR